MNISDIANVVVALTSVTAIVLGITTYWFQNRQAKCLLGIQILREFEDNFFGSENMLRLRYTVCSYYKEHRDDGWDAPESWRLADQLSGICFYINKGYIGKEAAWSVLYFWLDKYYCLLSRYTERLKESEDGVDWLKDFREAHALLTQYGIKEHNLKGQDIRWRDDKILEFLDDEITETSSALACLHTISLNQVG